MEYAALDAYAGAWGAYRIYELIQQRSERGSVQIEDADGNVQELRTGTSATPPPFHEWLEGEAALQAAEEVQRAADKAAVVEIAIRRLRELQAAGQAVDGRWVAASMLVRDMMAEAPASWRNKPPISYRRLLEKAAKGGLLELKLSGVEDASGASYALGRKSL